MRDDFLFMNGNERAQYVELTFKTMKLLMLKMCGNCSFMDGSAILSLFFSLPLCLCLSLSL